MITVKVLHGSGMVDYLLESISDSGAAPGTLDELTAYYAAAGTPPGRWMGKGLSGLGSEADTTDSPIKSIGSGDLVVGDQLKALIGEGVDPVTGQQLGRRFAVYRTEKDRVKARIADLPKMSESQRVAAIARIKTEEAARGPSPQAVHGFDFTFSPPKEVSLLWGLGDPGMRELVAAAHREAMDEIVDRMEREVIRTRLGVRGVAQTGTRGIVAAAFDHWDSRSGDPHLHTHLVVANRVQGQDGKWRTIDSNGTVFPATVALSETYDNLLMDKVATRLGVNWVGSQDPRDAAKYKWTIEGMPPELVAHFAQRRNQILEAKRASGDTSRAGDVRAWRDTRTQKVHQPLSDLVASWRHRADEVLGGDGLAGLWHTILHRKVREPGTDLKQGERQAPVGLADLDDETLTGWSSAILTRLEERRSTFTRWNVQAEAERYLRGIRTISADARQQITTAVTNTLLAQCLQIGETAASRHTPTKWLRPDGSSMFVAEDQQTYTTQRIINSERRLLGAAQDGKGIILDGAITSAALSAWRSQAGHELSQDQRTAIFAATQSHHTMDVLVGPAGAGKTTALAALAQIWADQVGPVRALAPSANAAEIIGESLNVRAENLAKWNEAFLRLGYGSKWDLQPGELIIVDEASMAASSQLDLLVQRAGQVGAKVLLVGDPAQLGAVGTGSVFNAICRSRPTAAFDEVRRFAAPWEAHASLELRAGSKTALAYYGAEGRLRGDLLPQATEHMVTAWLADRQAGYSSIIVAPDNTTAANVSALARAHLIDAGILKSGSPEVSLYYGVKAAAGDEIVTRQNDRRTKIGGHWIRNGDIWKITKVHRGGDISVQRIVDGVPTGTIGKLSAKYVSQYVDLAYALTPHRAQGLTVDTCHALITEQTTRQSAYVAMTRGRLGNWGHVGVAAEPDDDGKLDPQAAQTPREVFERVLANDASELAAVEVDWKLRDKNNAIGQVLAEYKTIIGPGRLHEAGQLLKQADLDPELADRIKEAGSWMPLAVAITEARAAGMPLTGPTLGEICSFGTLDPTDPASTVLARLNSWADQFPTKHAAGPLGGLVPAFEPTTKARKNPEVQRAAAQRVELLEQRSELLLDRAIQGRAPWLSALGDPPSQGAAYQQWRHAAQIIAAYRELAGIRNGSGEPDDPVHMAAGSLARARALGADQQVIKDLEAMAATAADPLGVPGTDWDARRAWHIAADALQRAQTLTRTLVGPAQPAPARATDQLER